jgi:hypothetical protein
MSMLLRFDCDDLPFRLVIDDDDRVGYAYVLENEKIVGDVWVYNVMPAPQEPEWTDRSKLPFLNPQEFSYEGASPITEETQLDVVWIRNQDTLVRAEIYLANQLFAIVAPGAKPGWCRNARKTGPLARVLEAE